jgi:hypothetical protein
MRSDVDLGNLYLYGYTDKGLPLIDSSAAKGVSGRKECRPSIENVVQHFVDYSCRNGNQDHIGAGLDPLITIIMGQTPNQTAIKLLGNAGWNRLATREVFLNAWRKRLSATPVFSIIAKDDPDSAHIDSRAMIPAATTVVSFAATISMLALMRVAFSIAWVSKESRRARDKCNAGQNRD